MRITFFAVTNGSAPEALVTLGDQEGKIVVLKGASGIVEGLELVGHPASELRKLPQRFCGSRFYAKRDD
jgi:hypothetical protein